VHDYATAGHRNDEACRGLKAFTIFGNEYEGLGAVERQKSSLHIKRNEKNRFPPQMSDIFGDIEAKAVRGISAT